MSLIPRPDLDLRNEEQLAAQAIASASSNCPELANANPFAPHTVLLETFAWLLGQMGYRINQIPEQNLIEFARLHGITLKPATAATTILRFTMSAPEGFDAIIPQGTHVATEDGFYVFTTETQLVITSSGEETSGNVVARRSDTGHTLLSPNLLTNLLDPIAYITAVTNLAAIDSGTEEETIESALERARQYQRRAERIVTAQDLEEAILHDALNGNGIVRAFQFIENGDFDSQKVGRTTVIVMTKTGDIINDNEKKIIAQLMGQIVGNQWVYLHDPFYVDFDVTANVRLRNSAIESATLAAIKKNIENFYAPSRANFGRDILRSEIIAVIEGTEGVDRIIAQGKEILSAPSVDTRLKAWELPHPQTITINVV